MAIVIPEILSQLCLNGMQDSPTFVKKNVANR